jgi:hypothetical protein
MVSQKSNDQDFNPSPVSYEIDEEKENGEMKNLTWTQKISYQIRLYLWMNYVDHILFMHLEKKHEEHYNLKKPKFENYGVFRLMEAAFLSRSH